MATSLCKQKEKLLTSMRMTDGSRSPFPWLFCFSLISFPVDPEHLTHQPFEEHLPAGALTRQRSKLLVVKHKCWPLGCSLCLTLIV